VGKVTINLKNKYTTNGSNMMTVAPSHPGSYFIYLNTVVTDARSLLSSGIWMLLFRSLVVEKHSCRTINYSIDWRE